MRISWQCTDSAVISWSCTFTLSTSTVFQTKIFSACQPLLIDIHQYGHRQWQQRLLTWKGTYFPCSPLQFQIYTFEHVCGAQSPPALPWKGSVVWTRIGRSESCKEGTVSSISVTEFTSYCRWYPVSWRKTCRGNVLLVVNAGVGIPKNADLKFPTPNKIFSIFLSSPEHWVPWRSRAWWCMWLLRFEDMLQHEQREISFIISASDARFGQSAHFSWHPDWLINPSRYMPLRFQFARTCFDDSVIQVSLTIKSFPANFTKFKQKRKGSKYTCLPF